MNIYTAEVKLVVNIEAFNEDDALDEIDNEFGKGIYGAVEVVNTTIENLE